MHQAMKRIRPSIPITGCVAGLAVAGLLMSDPTATAGTTMEKGKPHHPVTRLVTKTPTGEPTNGDSTRPGVSGDCSAVAFTSTASNLVTGDTRRWADVFVRDRAGHRIILASQGLRGAHANGDSRSEALSSTGRFVLYDSAASNLVPADRNGHDDVFVRDIRRQRSELVSDAIGRQSPDGVSLAGDISANGRYVAFSSDASNLVPGDTNTYFDVFVRDRATGTTERVSVPPGDGESDEASYQPTISANGRFVTFESVASNLVPDDVNQTADVFRFDRRTGDRELVTVAADGSQLAFGGVSPDMSADAGTATFWTPDGQPVAGDDNDTFDVFVRDIRAGTTELGAMTDSDDFPASASSDGVLSADGNALAFLSVSTDVAVPDTDSDQDVFIRDREAGTTVLVSQSTRGTPGDGQSFAPSISADGRCVAFASQSTNLARADDNGEQDIYLRRLPR
jgi:Tol biopolymer transport system component